MTMTKISSKKTCYTYGHGPLINLFHGRLSGCLSGCLSGTLHDQCPAPRSSDHIGRGCFQSSETIMRCDEFWCFFKRCLTGCALDWAASLGDRQPRTIPTKDPPHQVIFIGGWCANCRNLRKGKICTTPSLALAMLIVDVVGVVRGFSGHTPSTAGTFRKKLRKNSGKTPETLSERFLEFPSRVRLGSPRPYN